MRNSLNLLVGGNNVSGMVLQFESLCYLTNIFQKSVGLWKSLLYIFKKMSQSTFLICVWWWIPNTCVTHSGSSLTINSFRPTCVSEEPARVHLALLWWHGCLSIISYCSTDLKIILFLYSFRKQSQVQKGKVIGT